MLIYSQSTGRMTRDGVEIARGFAGNNYRPKENPTGIKGRNNPDAQNLHCIGPLPQGLYRIGDWGVHPPLGPNSAPLTQVSGETFGRSGFFIHGPGGADPDNSSEGCICLLPMPRLVVSHSGETQLQVTA